MGKMITLITVLLALVMSWKNAVSMDSSDCMFICTSIDHPLKVVKCRACAEDLPVNEDMCWRACAHSKRSNSLSELCDKCFESKPSLMFTLCQLVCKGKNEVLMMNVRTCEVCHAYLAAI